MIIEKCPVCNGRGIVPQMFYTVPEGQDFTSSSTAPETCRSCYGKGYIIDPIDSNEFDIDDYYEITYGIPFINL